MLGRLTVVGFLFSAMSFAVTPVSKVSVGIKGLLTSSNSGMLLGASYAHFMSESFHVGGAVHTGQIAEGSSGSFTFGGFLGSFSGEVGETTSMSINLIVGAAGGFTTANGPGGGLAIEPSLSFSLEIGETSRVTFAGGYLWIPDNQTFRGYTATMTFDFMNGLERVRKPPSKVEPLSNQLLRSTPVVGGDDTAESPETSQKTPVRQRRSSRPNP